MDADISSILAGFLLSTVGFSVFLYGKKQARPPQLVAGLAMMVLPFAVPGALWMSLAGAGLMAALWLAVRSGL